MIHIDKYVNEPDPPQEQEEKEGHGQAEEEKEGYPNGEGDPLD